MAQNRDQDLNRERQGGRQDDQDMDLGNRMDRDRTLNREQDGNRSTSERENRGRGGQSDRGEGGLGQSGGSFDDEDFGSSR